MGKGFESFHPSFANAPQLTPMGAACARRLRQKMFCGLHRLRQLQKETLFKHIYSIYQFIPKTTFKTTSLIMVLFKHQSSFYGLLPGTTPSALRPPWRRCGRRRGGSSTCPPPPHSSHTLNRPQGHRCCHPQTCNDYELYEIFLLLRKWRDSC